jgi:hypothetical protein
LAVLSAFGQCGGGGAFIDIVVVKMTTNIDAFDIEAKSWAYDFLVNSTRSDGQDR